MPKILIVDDEVDICEMMALSFNSHGFQTLLAHDAEAAYQLVLHEDPDLVVSDIRMPKGGGMKLLRDIKQHNVQRPKVFLITGYSDSSKEEALSLGAEDVLPKPIRLMELVQRVSGTLPESSSS